jgi:hypothetical protein
MIFVPIGDGLFDKKFEKSPLKRQVEASQILDFAAEVFSDLFGKEQAYHVKPLFLKNRTLTVSCGNLEIAQEIRLNQADIVDKINSKLEKKEVDSIRYLA